MRWDNNPFSNADYTFIGVMLAILIGCIWGKIIAAQPPEQPQRVEITCKWPSPVAELLQTAPVSLDIKF